MIPPWSSSEKFVLKAQDVITKSHVYVSMMGLIPQEHFANHKAGAKATVVVSLDGVRLIPELLEHLNPMQSSIQICL